MEFLKPDVNRIFAATGSSIAPSNVKINLGWVSEIPDFEFENWIQNRQDSFIAHINQVGVVTWDAETEYRAGKSFIQSTDGIIYKALTTNKNKLPQSNTLDWKPAFSEFGFSYSKAESDSLFLIRGNNLSDLSSSGAARTNLSVYSRNESDLRYLDKSKNLSELPNKETARSNLSVYPKAEVWSRVEADGRFLTESENLSDLADTTTARTNLGVYSKGSVDGLVAAKASISGQTFTGNILAPNLSGTNTGDQINIAGNAATVSNVGTSQVGSATAGLSAGSVGSYAFLRRKTSSEILFGSVEAGSNLQPAAADGGAIGSVSGTWRIMGYIRLGGDPERTSLCLRIA